MNGGTHMVIKPCVNAEIKEGRHENIAIKIAGTAASTPKINI